VPPFTCGSGIGAIFVVSPVAGLRMPVTRRGLNTAPLAASTDVICASCMGVTDMNPWPMPKFTESPGYHAPSEGSLYCFNFHAREGSSPDRSPLMSMPVGLPKPKGARNSWMRSGPSW
jgi:hypothetical protein